MKSTVGRKFLSLSFILLLVSFSLISFGCGGDKGSDPPAGPQINVSTREIANGNVVLNNPLDQTVSIQNTGSANLNIGFIAQANPLAPPFSILKESDKCSNASVGPGGSCSFQVRFTPPTQASFNDSFDIPSNAVNENPVTVSVSGNGKALRVTINQVNTGQCGSGLLELLVTVTKNNILVSGLTASNFFLSENGTTKAATISQAQTAAPISVAFVLDYSTSMNNAIPDLEAASTAFINSMNTGDEAAIIKFAQYSQVMQDFTTDKTLLTTAINTPPPFTFIQREETYLYDALWSAIEKTTARQNSKAIILFSDGKDEDINFVPDVSTHTLTEVIAHAAEKNVAIFTIGLGNVNGGVMNQLANETGGQYFYAPSAGDLSSIYSAIKNLLAGQYSLQYSTSAKGASSIVLDVVSGTDQGGVSRQIQGCL